MKNVCVKTDLNNCSYKKKQPSRQSYGKSLKKVRITFTTTNPISQFHINKGNMKTTWK